ncbi:MAG: spore protease YyaC, partial [Bacillota bacterium]
MKLFNSYPKKIKTNKVHIDEPQAAVYLKKIISKQLLTTCHSPKSLVVFCIGTDRSTGDALGPLVGSELNSFKLTKKIKVYGTLDNPIHATNIKTKIKEIKYKHKKAVIIAVDAGLG